MSIAPLPKPDPSAPPTFTAKQGQYLAYIYYYSKMAGSGGSGGHAPSRDSEGWGSPQGQTGNRRGCPRVERRYALSFRIPAPWDTLVCPDLPLAEAAIF